jgi:hypothetical protein
LLYYRNKLPVSCSDLQENCGNCLRDAGLVSVLRHYLESKELGAKIWHILSHTTDLDCSTFTKKLIVGYWVLNINQIRSTSKTGFDICFWVRSARTVVPPVLCYLCGCFL